MGELGAEWRKLNVDPAIQKYKKCGVPSGFKVLYAIVNRHGSEKAYIGKAGHSEKGAEYRVYHRGGHIQGPLRGRSAIHDAIKAHGWQSFEWFILAGPIPKEEINDAEKNAIARFNTLTKSQDGNGYNIMKGGDGGEKTDDMIAKQKATMATEESKAKRSSISKNMWTPDYREKMSMRLLGSAKSIAKRTSSIKKSKAKPLVIANHKKGGELMWQGEKGELRRQSLHEVVARKREELRAIALPLPSNTKDRVHGSVYIVQVAKRSQKPGDLVKWRTCRTRSGTGTTGTLVQL